MTVSTQAVRAAYACDGSTTAYPVPFQFFGADELLVITKSAGNVLSTLTRGTDYAVSGGAGSTGSIATTSALASGVTLYILRATTRTQTTAYVEGGPLSAASLVNALDRNIGHVQELWEAVGRTLRAPAGEAPFAPLPPRENLKGQLLGFNANGDPIGALPSAALISGAMQPVVEAGSIPAALAALGIVLPLPVASGGTGASSASGGLRGLGVSDAMLSVVGAGSIAAAQTLLGIDTKAARFVTPQKYGAVGDGETDDTAAFQSWLNALVASGDIGYIPATAPFYKITTALIASSPQNLFILGAGANPAYGAQRNSTLCLDNAGSSALLSVTGATNAVISGVGFSTKSKAGSGSLLEVGGNYHLIEKCAFGRYMTAMKLTANVGAVRDCTFYDPVATYGTGILVDGYAGGLVLDNPLFYAVKAANMPHAGIELQNAGCVMISNGNIIRQGTDLLIDPGTGQAVASVFATNTFFDTAYRGIAVVPTGTGQVLRGKFVECWTSSHQDSGVLLQNSGTSSLIQSMEFIGHTAILNGSSGFNTNPSGSYRCVGIDILGGLYAANGGAGINLTNCSRASIVGARAGSFTGLAGNSTYGAVISSSVESINVQANDFGGNTIGALSNSATVNTNIGNNLVA